MKKIIGFVLLMIITSMAVSAVEIHVPVDQPYIQSAVNVAVNGDVIIVADGQYFEPGNTNVNLLGKQLTIRSANDNPGVCVINCYSNGRAFYLGAAASGICEIRGFTVISGNVTSDPLSHHGGAIYIGPGNSLSVENCIFTSNTADQGGGIYGNAPASVSVEDCTFNANSATSGGGIFLVDAGAFSLLGSTFSDHSVASNGGAVYCSQSDGTTATLLVQDTDMSNNSAGLAGSAFYSESEHGYADFEFGATCEFNSGGVYAVELINHNTYLIQTDYVISYFDCNQNNGGALKIDGCYSVTFDEAMTGGRFWSSGNGHDGNGGSIYANDCPGGLSLSSGYFTNNDATGNGGSIYADGTPLYLTRCLFRGNEADPGSTLSRGGAVFCDDGIFTTCCFAMNEAGGNGGAVSANGLCEFINCGIGDNTAYDGGGAEFYGTGSGVFTNSIVWDNTIDSTASNLNVNGPCTGQYCNFENGQGPSQCDHCLTEDPLVNWLFCGLTGGPCMDAGINNGAHQFDLNGNPVPVGFKIDMGVWEVQYATTCETSFESVSTYNEASLFDTGCGFTAEPDLFVQVDTTDLDPGEPVEVYLLEENDTDFTVHLMDALDPATGCLDYGTTYARTVYNGGDLYVVVDGGEGTFDLEIRCNFPSNIRIGSQKFSTIQSAIDHSQNGDTILLADGTYTGLHNRNIDFDGHSVSIESVSGHPEDCVIDCEGVDRGMVINSGESSVVLHGFSLINGTGSVTGAGLQCSGTSPAISNCIFRDNASTFAFGGGIYMSSSNAVLTNCVITGNSVVSGFGGTGGGIYCSDTSSPSFINCTITGNTAESGGGGMTIAGGSAYLIQNCIFWGNIGQSGENEIQSSIATSVDNCNIQGSCPPNITCVDSISDDPGFVIPAYHLPEDSPCIDTGLDIGAPLDDIDGEERPNPFWGIVVTDIGADEYYAPCLNHGDVNADGSLTASDAQEAFLITLGLMTPTYDQRCAADCNGDGSVTAADAQSIFLAVLGMGAGCEDA